MQNATGLADAHRKIAGTGRLKVCVLQPDYSGSEVDYGNHDPRRDLSALLPEATVDHLFLRKATVHRQLRQAAGRGYDIYVNLCEGYLDWDIPSIDVIWHLDRLGLPYTGSPAHLYDPSKELMKYVAHVQGVATPRFVASFGPTIPELGELRFPLFVKPGHAGDSLGIDAASLVSSISELDAKARAVAEEFGSALIEEFVDGREFTVLLAANPQDRNRPVVLRPLEFVFPPGQRFKSYDLKVTQHHPECNVAVADPGLDRRLREAARLIFTGFSGQGYARLDFRMDAEGTIFFLDINFACSVFYGPGSEGSADYILRQDPLGAAGFLRQIIAEGIARHRQARRLWIRKSRSSNGFGIFSACQIDAGQVIFPGEERAIRLVTRGHLARNWSEEEREIARHYAIPYSDELLALWHLDPAQWAPQNHSCAPNTAYRGLDVVALRAIPAGEELTLDYSSVCNENLPPFPCRCGAANCRGEIRGTPGLSLTSALACEPARSGG
jgi:D-alanine-D-alanine ligase-like ATP-grasp enzyme